MGRFEELPREILWMIFSDIDYRTSLNMQQTSKFWHDTIACDSTIMEKIALATSKFLRPDWKTSCVKYNKIEQRLQKNETLEITSTETSASSSARTSKLLMMDMPLEHHVDVYAINDSDSTVICKRVEGDWHYLDTDCGVLKRCDEPEFLRGRGRYVVTAFPGEYSSWYVLITEDSVILVGEDYEFSTLADKFHCRPSDLYKGIFLYAEDIFIVIVNDVFHFFDTKQDMLICTKKFKRDFAPGIDEFASFATTGTHLFHINPHSGLYAISLQQLVYSDDEEISFEDLRHVVQLDRDIFDQWYFGRNRFSGNMVTLSKSHFVLEVDVEKGICLLNKIVEGQWKVDSQNCTVISCQIIEQQMCNNEDIIYLE